MDRTEIAAHLRNLASTTGDSDARDARDAYTAGDDEAAFYALDAAAETLFAREAVDDGETAEWLRDLIDGAA